MNKKILLLLFLSCLLFILPQNVYAAYDAIINGSSVRIRSGAGTNYSALYTVGTGTPISVVDKTLYSGDGCSAKWYKVTYKSKTGYVCSTYVKFVDNSYSGMNTSDWEARVNANNINVRKGAGTKYASLGQLSLGVNVQILSTTSVNDSNCSSGKWYKIKYYVNKTGYICSKYVTKKSSVTATNEEYALTLKAAGFTDSYIPYLTYLHNKYPEWTFIAKNTKVAFSTAVSSEEGKNYMQTTNDNYRTSNKPAEGSSWFYANTGVIAFYMDPRNWLTEGRIFMFEKLDYTEDFDDKYPQMIKSIFGSGKLSADKYTIPMFNAGKTNKISPVHIASRIKQEVGANGSASTSGEEFTWKGKKYSGYYNFFNIGAYEVTIDGVHYSAVTRGLAYAAKLVRSSGSLWNNIETAITEGSQFLANGYINSGQGTLYYQKFNVSPDAHYSRYTHQYMTNIQAPATEGNSAYNSYKAAGILNEPFIFEIPVYNYMPPSTSLPDSGDINNDLATLEVEGYSISPNFDEDVIDYETFVPNTTTEVVVKATAKSSKATIAGTGTVTLNDEDTVVTIAVTSETQDVKRYTVTIKKVNNGSGNNDNNGNNGSNDDNGNNNTGNGDNNNNGQTEQTSFDTILNNAAISLTNDDITNIKYNTSASTILNRLTSAGATNVTITDNKNNPVTNSSLIGTGYKLNITLNNETKTYVFVIRGDTSGDGKINSLDLLQILKHINGDKKLTSYYLKAADTSRDNKVNSLDLLQVLKHINGDKKL